MPANGEIRANPQTGKVEAWDRESPRNPFDGKWVPVDMDVPPDVLRVLARFSGAFDGIRPTKDGSWEFKATTGDHWFTLEEAAKEAGVLLTPSQGEIIPGEQVGGPPGSFFIRQPSGSLTPYNPPRAEEQEDPILNRLQAEGENVRRQQEQTQPRTPSTFDQAILEALANDDFAKADMYLFYKQHPTSIQAFDFALSRAETPAEFFLLLELAQGPALGRAQQVVQANPNLITQGAQQAQPEIFQPAFQTQQQKGQQSALVRLQNLDPQAAIALQRELDPRAFETPGLEGAEQQLQAVGAREPLVQQDIMAAGDDPTLNAGLPVIPRSPLTPEQQAAARRKAELEAMAQQDIQAAGGDGAAFGIDDAEIARLAQLIRGQGLLAPATPPGAQTVFGVANPGAPPGSLEPFRQEGGSFRIHNPTTGQTIFGDENAFRAAGPGFQIEMPQTNAATQPAFQTQPTFNTLEDILRRNRKQTSVPFNRQPFMVS